VSHVTCARFVYRGSHAAEGPCACQIEGNRFDCDFNPVTMAPSTLLVQTTDSRVVALDQLGQGERGVATFADRRKSSDFFESIKIDVSISTRGPFVPIFRAIVEDGVDIGSELLVVDGRNVSEGFGELPGGCELAELAGP
jgi:hypothetical protein